MPAPSHEDEQGRSDEPAIQQYILRLLAASVVDSNGESLEEGLCILVLAATVAVHSGARAATACVPSCEVALLSCVVCVWNEAAGRRWWAMIKTKQADDP